jgi:ABC-type uncharacterized transport system involved in gliding motility auxiliary subunit
MKIVDRLKNGLRGLLVAFGIGVVGAAKSRQARYGSNSLIALLAMVGILVLVNLMVRNQGWRWDATKNQVNSLSKETINVVKKISKPVKFVVFARPEFQEEPRKLIKEYSARNKNITVEFVNPYEKPTVAQQYGITRPDTTLVIQGDQRQEQHANTDTDFTTALIKLSNPKKVSVVFWTGTGEKTPEDTGDNGFSAVKDSLANLNYEVSSQNSILNPQIATGTGVLVIAGPQKTYTEPQKQAVLNYLNDGGRLLVLFDPVVGTIQRSGLEDVISKFGIDIANGLVVDPVQSVNGDPRIPAIDTYEKHQITDTLQVTLFPGVLKVDISSNPPANFGGNKLLSTTNQSWLETNLSQGAQILKDPSDPAGPVTIGVAVNNTSKDKNDKKSSMRIVAFGDSDLGTNLLTRPEQGKTIYAPGNMDLIVNSINWLSAQENLINITPKDKTNPPLTLTTAQSQQIFYLVLIVMPAVFLILGVIVWRIRRRSKKK